MSAHARLRAATAADHAHTDSVFSGFDLADVDDYRAFLRAHARILPEVEDRVAADSSLPPFRPRAGLLLDDLAGLGAVMPLRLSIGDPGDPAERLGMLYVIEGSRLGGGLLATRVAEGLPKAYLSAVHQRGEWRAFCQTLDAADRGEAWFSGLLSGARRIFAAYAEAARAERAD